MTRYRYKDHWAEYHRWKEKHRLLPLRQRYIREVYGISDDGEALLERALQLAREWNRQLDILKSPTAGDQVVTYVVRNDLTGLYKIGQTTNLNRRLASLRTAMPGELEIVHTVYRDKSIEAELHRRFKNRHASREWYSLAEKDIDDLRRIPERLGGDAHVKARGRAEELEADLGRAYAAMLVLEPYSYSAEGYPQHPSHEIRQLAKDLGLPAIRLPPVRENFNAWAVRQPNVKVIDGPLGEPWIGMFTDPEAKGRFEAASEASEADSGCRGLLLLLIAGCAFVILTLAVSTA